MSPRPPAIERRSPALRQGRRGALPRAPAPGGALLRATFLEGVSRNRPWMLGPEDLVLVFDERLLGLPAGNAGSLNNARHNAAETGGTDQGRAQGRSASRE